MMHVCTLLTLLFGRLVLITGKELIVFVSIDFIRWCLSCFWSKTTVVGSLPNAKQVIVANANRPQSTLPVCFATFINFTSSSSLQLRTSWAITMSVSSSQSK